MNQKNLVNLVAHLSDIKYNMKMAKAFGNQYTVKKCKRALNEINRILNLENTILVESSDLKKTIDSLGLTSGQFVKIYGAHYDCCLSVVDTLLTIKGIPHDLAKNGYI